MLIDSHAHLTSPQLEGEVRSILERAKKAGITSIINICTNPKELSKGLELEKEFPWIHNAAATTPHDVEKDGENDFETIAAFARLGKLAAIGETGLDYHYEHSNRTTQQSFLRRYFHLALECKLPVIIHCREAFSDFFQILDEDYRVKGKSAPGVLHCFTGSVSEAEQIIEREWYLSLSGIVTFKKSLQLQEVAKMVPLESLLIETDAPYLAPQKYRGKMNEPAYLVETAQFIADIKGISYEDLSYQTAENAKNLFPKLT